MAFLNEAGLERFKNKNDAAYAAKSHKHAASDINSGTLPIANGGTGSSTAAAARTALGITPANIGAAAASHAHSYAGSASEGGSATSAVKLDTASAGSATQPVYFSGGKPVATTYTLGKSVPSNAVFTDTNTWVALKGATTDADGTAGYAPAPAKGAANRYLRSDGTWAVPPDTNTTYAAATQSAQGLMSAADKKKLDGIASGANAYTHPAHTAKSAGLYKVTVDALGHVSAATAVTKADITALGIPGSDTNTTYSPFTAATASAAGAQGLVPAPAAGDQAKFLRGDKTWTAVTPALIGAATSGHTHNYAGSSSAGGAATTALACTGNAATATKLATARNINGTNFDGTGNITTANWGTARTITVGNTGKSVNGSGNVSWSMNEIGAARGWESSATTAATAGWYRIAASAQGISNCMGTFEITGAASGYHTNVVICAGTSYGVAAGTTITQLACSNYSNAVLTQARIVYHTTYGNNYAYLEVYLGTAIATTILVKAVDVTGWSAVAPNTAGSVPSGYTTKAISFSNGNMVGNLAGNASTASTATALSSNAGSATQPVYFSGGKPVACTYTLGKSVPSNAVFTDTNTWIALKGSTTSAAGTAGYAPAPAAGAANRYLRCDGTWQVPPDTNTTYSAATQSAQGLMSAADKKKLDGIATGANAYSLPVAASGTRGGVKIGYAANGKNYPVQLSNEQMYVNVPWTDTNTTYSAMKGATTSAAGTAGLAPAPAAGAANRYLRSDGTWQVPPDTNTNTTYSAGAGISLSGTTFSNSGVRSISSGTTNGTISVNTNGTAANVAVKGLGSAAYTASTAYAAASHNHSAANITSGTLGVARGGTGATAAGRTLLSNIGITSGTGAPPATGVDGSIYIQYA